MILSDFRGKLRNDISIHDEPILRQHDQMMLEAKYSEGAALLRNHPQIDAVTASLFNQWERKIMNLKELLDAKPFYDPYVYADSEPEQELMDDKAIWQQEY